MQVLFIELSVYSIGWVERGSLDWDELDWEWMVWMGWEKPTVEPRLEFLLCCSPHLGCLSYVYM